MPASFDLDAATRVCARAFEPSAQDLLGLELEWPVRALRPDPDAPDDRPTSAAMAELDGRLLPGGSHVTWEPGGQVEVSSAPAGEVSALLAAARTDDAALGDLLLREGLQRLDVAVDRIRRPRRVVDRPRYAAMEAFFDSQGPCGRQMMTATAGTQINLSHAHVDPLRRWRALHRLGPVLLACFAASPGRDRDGRHWASLRQGIWSDVDPARTHSVPADVDPVVAWRDYALAADVFFMIEPGSSGSAGTPVPPGLTFGEWLCRSDRRRPTAEDLEYHLTTLFPPIRPRGWLELRFLDLLPSALREVAVLTVAVAADLPAHHLARMPDTSDAWTRAARYGLDDTLLGSAARTLLGLVEERVGRISDDAAHREAVAELRARLGERRPAAPDTRVRG